MASKYDQMMLDADILAAKSRFAVAVGVVAAAILDFPTPRPAARPSP